MTIIRLLVVGGLLAACLSAFDDLPADQVALLQDSGGWEYISMDDSQDGFPTQHVCFDGQPHPDSCSGKLTLADDHTFVQQVSIHHQTVSRHGTYELNGDQLAFFDEFGTRDGPYTISIDSAAKLLAMNMPQVKVKLQLYKEYQKQLSKSRQNNKGQ